MKSFYKGKVKVVGADLLCFPVDPVTMEPLSCGCYDPWVWKDPDPIETIDVTTWQLRLNSLRTQNRKEE